MLAGAGGLQLRARVQGCLQEPGTLFQLASTDQQFAGTRQRIGPRAGQRGVLGVEVAQPLQGRFHLAIRDQGVRQRQFREGPPHHRIVHQLHGTPRRDDRRLGVAACELCPCEGHLQMTDHAVVGIARLGNHAVQQIHRLVDATELHQALGLDRLHDERDLRIVRSAGQR